MKNLTVIKGVNETFVLVDVERDGKHGITAKYVRHKDYDFSNGFYLEDHAIEIYVSFTSLSIESVSGYEYPIYKTRRVHPNDDDFNFDAAEDVAREDAHDLLLRKYDLKSLVVA